MGGPGRQAGGPTKFLPEPNIDAHQRNFSPPISNPLACNTTILAILELQTHPVKVGISPTGVVLKRCGVARWSPAMSIRPGLAGQHSGAGRCFLRPSWSGSDPSNGLPPRAWTDFEGHR